MLGKRILVVVVLLPVFLAVNALSLTAFALFFLFFLAIAAYEYCRLFRRMDLEPAFALTIGGVLAVVAARAFWGFEAGGLALAVLVLAAMAYHLVMYERGRDKAGADFAVTLGGVLYIGWIGGYFVSLRSLPEGAWWVLMVLPAVWLADTGAYFVGRALGKHKIAPRLSPGKSWEGYIGGIVVGVLFSALLAWVWGHWSPAMTPARGAILGLVMAVVTPLGDLGESMLKRMVGAKDSGNILPGHGGILDRIDSWLWAATIGYYMVTWLWL